jgi:NAD(P)-dependent dehydrogenase (short-subunit alcohol dehydrogenase family)
MLQDLTGKTYVVTGANTGIGYQTALQLARQNATVVMGVRSLRRGREAVDRIVATLPDAARQLHLLELDLADLQSVRRFAETVLEVYPVITALVNNGGVMMVPKGTTVQVCVGS